MPRTCPSCGRENADDVDFCAGCGGYLRWEPTKIATPAVPPKPPVQAPPPAQPPQQAQPAQPAAPAQQPPAQAQQPPPPSQPAQAEPPPAAAPEQEGRLWAPPNVPGGGGVQGPGVQAPNVQAPRVNVGAGGVNVAGPRVQAPRVQAPRVQPPRVPQPRAPTTPAGFIQALKKLKLPSRGSGSQAEAADSAVAPQPKETWQWQAVGEGGGGKGKALLVVLLLVLLAAGGAAAGWWFFVRDDGSTAKAAAPASGNAQTRAFVGRIQPLLVRSARDRARISRAISEVSACSIFGRPAAAQVRATIRGRQAVLRRLRGVPRPNAQAQNTARLLDRSLRLSAAAAADYVGWINTALGSCPVTSGPEFRKAQATNARAQAAKRAFSRAYNPMARQVGNRTWTHTQF
jgi:hypothetical protein